MTKRIAIVALCIALLAAAAWANHSKRIAELQSRQKMIIVEINDRTAIINAQQAAMDNLRIEFMKNQGAIEELQRQDARDKPPGN